MTDLEGLTKLLFNYGPFAVLIIFVFIIETKARKALKEASQNTKWPFLAVYLGVWVVIFALVVDIGYEWRRMNREFTISGRFENLSGSEKIASREEGLFLSRRYLPNGAVDDYWRLITPKKIEEGTRISFIFDRGATQESKENFTEHELVIRKGFYEAPVLIRYKRQQKKLILVHEDNREEEIPPLDHGALSSRKGGSGFFAGIAQAAEAPPVADFAKRLESDDPIIRRDARMELARMGDKALPSIQKVLEDPKSSYRLRLGVITALGSMEQLKPENLSPSTLNAIIEASADKDDALRGSALRFFGKHASEALNSQVQQALSKARADSATERLSHLARAQFEILYNLGIREKDDYGHKLHDGKDHFQAAVKYFQDAWDLHALAVPNDQVFFTKALYGWGHVLHDRSMIELAGGQRQPDMIKAAQNKFQEFLQAFEQAPSNNKYLYPNHKSLAKAYLENPVPQSLR